MRPRYKLLAASSAVAMALALGAAPAKAVDFLGIPLWESYPGQYSHYYAPQYRYRSSYYYSPPSYSSYTYTPTYDTYSYTPYRSYSYQPYRSYRYTPTYYYDQPYSYGPTYYGHTYYYNGTYRIGR